MLKLSINFRLAHNAQLIGMDRETPHENFREAIANSYDGKAVVQLRSTVVPVFLCSQFLANPYFRGQKCLWFASVAAGRRRGSNQQVATL
jgi:hypothetical protein